MTKQQKIDIIYDVIWYTDYIVRHYLDRWSCMIGDVLYSFNEWQIWKEFTKVEDTSKLLLKILLKRKLINMPIEKQDSNCINFIYSLLPNEN